MTAFATDPQPAARTGTGDTLSRVRAVSRAIAILRVFTPDQPYLGLGEIAGQAGLDAGTTRRLLVTLRDEGLISQDPRTGRYSLTMEMLRLARAVPEGRSLRDLAADLLHGLADQLGLTVFLSVEQGGEALCVARHHGEAPVQVRWWAVGGTLPLNCGAAPRLLLAWLDPVRQSAFLNAPLPALTGHSLTDRDALQADIAAIRARGWSHARDDVAEGLSALAAPVRDPNGRVIAAVSVGGLSPMISQPGQDAPRSETLSALLACCSELAARIASNDFTV
ncbi:MAG: IclR family transcriptional regulator [Pararhodobacter sp.]